jgi:hypothetical protein
MAKGYIIGRVDVTDPEAYMKSLPPTASPLPSMEHGSWSEAASSKLSRERPGHVTW